MPSLSSAATIELGRRDSAPHIAIDMPSNPLRAHLQDRLAAKWLLPGTRARGQEAIDQLSGFRCLGEALMSPHSADALATLHRIGVIDLQNGCGTATSGPQNAIELMVDYTPDWLSAPALRETSFPDIPLDITARLSQLTQLGVSIHGAKHTQRPPLALALYRADAGRWISALLAAGADPGSRTQVIRDNGTRPFITCLQLAVELKHTEASRLMTAALLPDSSPPLANSRFRDLMQLAFRADSTELFTRLVAHAQTDAAPNLAKAVHRYGRQIGPNIANTLAGFLSPELTLDAMGRPQIDAHRYLPLESETLTRSREAKRIALQGLNRLVDSGDAARIMALFRSLHAQSRIPRITPEFRQQYIDRIDTWLTATAPLRAIDSRTFDSLTHEFHNLWADRVSSPMLEAHESRARQALTNTLQQAWGDQAAELLKPQPRTDANPELETNDEALLRACEYTLTTAVEVKQGAQALEEWKQQLRAGNTTEALTQVLREANQSRTNEIFNALLTAALERGNIKGATTVLGTIASNPPGVHIEDPVTVLRTIAKRNRTERADLTRRVCAILRSDANPPVSPQQVLEQIEQIVSGVNQRTLRQFKLALIALHGLSMAASAATVFSLDASLKLHARRLSYFSQRHKAMAAVFGDSNADFFRELERSHHEPDLVASDAITSRYQQWKIMLNQGLINLTATDPTIQPEADFAFAEYLEQVGNFDRNYGEVPSLLAAKALAYSPVVYAPLVATTLLTDFLPCVSPLALLMRRIGRRSAAELRQQLQQELAPQD